MDTTEPAYISAGGSVKPEPGLFDFNENQTSGTDHFKNLGVFVEHNNNSTNETTIPKNEESAFEGPMFWGDKDSGLLDEISPWTEYGNATDNTDGPVYTLTVLNSQEQWCKKRPENNNLDFDSFLNILPENESDSSSYFYPEYTSYPPDKPNDLGGTPPPNNNNTWKTNNNNVTNGESLNDSLLRNALQGKSFHKGYSSCRKQPNRVFNDTTPPYPIPNGSNHIDDILGLSGIDHYSEDYEKIKKIANEVADCAKYVCPNEMFTSEVVPHSIANDTPSSSRCATMNMPRKPTKKPLPQISPSMKPHGTRKERSLHYCSICSKGFKDKYSVNVHVRTHTGEKPFTCNLCGKSFRQKAHLAKHYQTHLAQSQKHVAGNGTASSASASGKPRIKHPVVESHSIR